MNDSKSVSTNGSARLVRRCEALREAMGAARRGGKSIGLVPTMGALHEGHLSLVRQSKAECELTVVTIFVNPAQFGPHEDFGRYPRTLDRDLELLAAEGVDLVFAPDSDELYPPSFSTYVEAPRAAEPLEGLCRPGHFRGVATVVLKLFHLVSADVAYFGQKDYQQSVVIRRMVEDLHVPIRICVSPTVREPDGLALSSRNAYLSPAERQQALAIWGSLRRAAELVEQGERDAERVIHSMRQVLAEAGITQIDYVTLADPETLQRVHQITGRTVALIAATVGQTRLIDNCLLE